MIKIIFWWSRGENREYFRKVETASKACFAENVKKELNISLEFHSICYLIESSFRDKGISKMK